MKHKNKLSSYSEKEINIARLLIDKNVQSLALVGCAALLMTMVVALKEGGQANFLNGNSDKLSTI